MSIRPIKTAISTIRSVYDENGNLNTTLFKEWDPDAELWITSQKQVQFWSFSKITFSKNMFFHKSYFLSFFSPSQKRKNGR